MLLCVGEILADMIGEEKNGITTYERKAGGAPFNVACALKKFGADVKFVGSVGDDLIGTFLINYAKDFGMDTTYILFTKYISLASIMCAMLFPLLAFSLKDVFWGGGGFITLSALVIGGFVVFMHRENIKRLLEGKESKVSFSKKEKAEEKEPEAKKDESAPAKKYTNADFIQCSCGRTIPKTREKCVYCGERNPYFVQIEKKENKKNNKKK